MCLLQGREQPATMSAGPASPPASPSAGAGVPRSHSDTGQATSVARRVRCGQAGSATRCHGSLRLRQDYAAQLSVRARQADVR